MSKRRNKPKKRPDHKAPSAVLLAARLRGGAGTHRQRPTRSSERRQAIQEHS